MNNRVNEVMELLAFLDEWEEEMEGVLRLPRNSTLLQRVQRVIEHESEQASANMRVQLQEFIEDAVAEEEENG